MNNALRTGEFIEAFASTRDSLQVFVTLQQKITGGLYWRPSRGVEKEDICVHLVRAFEKRLTRCFPYLAFGRG
jgi:hypothetical protein